MKPEQWMGYEIIEKDFGAISKGWGSLTAGGWG